MIHNSAYIKTLIRKKVTGRLTPEESAELLASRRIYSDQEFDQLVAEVLLVMEDDLPQDGLQGWQPDFGAICPDESGKKSGSIRPLWLLVGGVAAAVLVLLGIFLTWRSTQDRSPAFSYDACTGLTPDMEVPVAESAFQLYCGNAKFDVSTGTVGELLRTDDLLVSKSDSGLLRLARLSNGNRKGTALLIRTGVQQQCVIELPDRTRVRLNAQSSVYYTTLSNGSEGIKLLGEAYLQRNDTPNDVPLFVRTPNGLVKFRDGACAIQAGGNYTRAAVRSGRTIVYSTLLKRELMLDCSGAQGMVMSLPGTPVLPRRDSLAYRVAENSEDAFVWTKAVRHYEHVPLRKLVSDMSQWYGWQVKNYNCIPADSYITTTVCYKKDSAALYALIRNTGVPLYENQGRISFCPEETEQRHAFGAAKILTLMKRSLN